MLLLMVSFSPVLTKCICGNVQWRAKNGHEGLKFLVPFANFTIEVAQRKFAMEIFVANAPNIHRNPVTELSQFQWMKTTTTQST